MENKKSHLLMIQNIISRMANNSFLLKGWCVTIISAICTLLNLMGFKIIGVALIPLVTFWLLDGYFLRQERLYRELYNKVRIVKNDDDIDFSMDVSIFGKKQDDEEKPIVDSWFETCSSITLSIFYGSIVSMVILVVAIKALYKFLG